MSTVINRPLGPNDPLYYAPKWALEADAPRRDESLPPNALPLAADRTAHSPARAEHSQPVDDAGIARLAQSPPLEPALTPGLLSAPPAERRADYWLKLFARVMLVAVVAQAAAVAAVGIPSLTGDKLPPLGGMISGLFSAKPAAKSARLETPRLVGGGGSGAVDEPLPLGVTLQGNADDGLFVLADLSADTALSAGQRIDVNTWRLSVGELAKAFVIPPRGYAGPMDIVVDLRRSAGNAMLGRRVLSMNWAAPPEAMAPAPIPVPARSDPPPRQIAAEEIAGIAQARRANGGERRSRGRALAVAPCRRSAGRARGPDTGRDLRSARARQARRLRLQGRSRQGARMVREGEIVRLGGSRRTAGKIDRAGALNGGVQDMGLPSQRSAIWRPVHRP